MSPRLHLLSTQSSQELLRIAEICTTVLSLFLICSCLLLQIPALAAQTDTATSDIRVQRLYAEAKAAEANGDLPGAVSQYEAILHIAPNLASAHNNLGALYIKLRQYGKAVGILKEGLRVDPEMSSASALLGLALFETRDYAEARAHLEWAVKSNPRDLNVALLLANDLVKVGDYRAAELRLRELARSESQNQAVWYLLGQVYQKLSEQSFARIDAINPNSELSHEIRGDINASMNNFARALAEYKKAVAIEPTKPGTHYKLGDAYAQIAKWPEAIEQFRAELVNDPNNCEAEWRIGNALIEQYSPAEEALSVITKALDLCPDLGEARVDRARALLTLNRDAEALSDLQAAEKSDPGESSTHFLLAKIYRRVGKSDQAKAEMEIFAKLEQEARETKQNVLKETLGAQQNAQEDSK